MAKLCSWVSSASSVVSLARPLLADPISRLHLTAPLGYLKPSPVSRHHGPTHESPQRFVSTYEEIRAHADLLTQLRVYIMYLHGIGMYDPQAVSQKPWLANRLVSYRSSVNYMGNWFRTISLRGCRRLRARLSNSKRVLNPHPARSPVYVGPCRE
jgi:hypothetical protein